MDAHERIRKLLVLGDNRLKQGLPPSPESGSRARDAPVLDKARTAYEEAVALAREAGLEAQVEPLVSLRLEEIERLKERPRGTSA